MRSKRNSTGVFSLRSILSLFGLVLVIGILIWVSFNVDVPRPAELREMVQGYGWAGWLIFIGITALIAITPIPVTIPALVAGSLYGVIEGTLFSYTGVAIGSWLGYWLARFTGQKWTFKILSGHGRTVKKYLSNAGFLAMCTARLMPGLPYWPVNYGAGALGVTQSTFVSATLLATLPGQISLVALGSFAANQSLFNGIVLVSAWVVVLVGTWTSYRYMKKSQKRVI
ncbi:TVP38/TMEM64 family protein [Aliicoccus persicus]|uniref:TVP38/TMEM64 family membrane protein n=1 Tax=Aliicoccus persicus TaxID=930138 RepID=A0A662Z3K9_9STAP|nr:VTT domain-containing protein [Aliicoccus persicus]SEV93405.1 Uncharacterized membrane protein YdjX, TVP38/TMEM64 family, SNARE-associated domain [Aliicoccus persicus]